MPAFATLPNLNALWASLLVEEFVRQGTTEFVIAPGSRSTPLVLAAVRHPQTHTQLCHDERGAAYYAVGHARATGRPAAVITTSGTAVANLLPAVVEAHNDHVPLVVLTADRPPELRDCGANQATEQATLMAPFVRFRHDLSCPTDAVPAEYVLGLAAQAVHRASGPFAGPVQLNCPFREPLGTTAQEWDRACIGAIEAWGRDNEPWIERTSRLATFDHGAIEALTAKVRSARAGVVIAGAIPATERTGGVAKLAARLGWPLVPDLRSGARLGTPTARPHWVRPDGQHADSSLELVLQFGTRLTDKSLQHWLDRSTIERALISRTPGRDDPGHARLMAIEGSPDYIADAVLAGLSTDQSRPAAAERSERERAIKLRLAEQLEPLDAPLSEPFVARWLSRHLPAESGLFVSSSLPIRDLQNWATTDGPHLVVDSNRGASGIDGVLASGIGFAAGLGRPSTLLIGDLALLHDLSSLALLATARPDLTVVILNNGGGSIFSTLPVAEETDMFTPWFDGAHAFGFEHASENFDLPYQRITSRTEFADAASAARTGPRVLEVQSSQESNRADQTALRQLLVTGR